MEEEIEAIKERIRYFARENENALSNYEEVKTELQNAVCWKESEVSSSVVVRARGLPWQATDRDVAQFFIGLNIAPGGVALCLSAEGRRNGEALVRFADTEQRELALRRHRQFLHNRYIEVYRATGEEFLQVAAEIPSVTGESGGPINPDSESEWILFVGSDSNVDISKYANMSAMLTVAPKKLEL
ncbi:hypothetical protein AB6A40_006284 [Gnathostoma spinigerum]|uniref:RRM domain-containing protein n=1 Tax=Gnathostoma spinigerum TaxID=75299 RepID=A0ABD6ETK5_9BILA